MLQEFDPVEIGRAASGVASPGEAAIGARLEPAAPCQNDGSVRSTDNILRIPIPGRRLPQQTHATSAGANALAPNVDVKEPFDVDVADDHPLADIFVNPRSVVGSVYTGFQHIDVNAEMSAVVERRLFNQGGQ